MWAKEVDTPWAISSSSSRRSNCSDCWSASLMPWYRSTVLPEGSGNRSRRREEREGWRNCRRAFASICRILSLPRPNVTAISSKVCSASNGSRPKRLLITFSSLGDKVYRTSLIVVDLSCSKNSNSNPVNVLLFQWEFVRVPSFTGRPCRGKEVCTAAVKWAQRSSFSDWSEPTIAWRSWSENRKRPSIFFRDSSSASNMEGGKL